jgi:hypothetical protein
MAEPMTSSFQRRFVAAATFDVRACPAVGHRR